MLLHITMELDDSTPLMNDSISLADALQECFAGYDNIKVSSYCDTDVPDSCVEIHVNKSGENPLSYMSLKEAFSQICYDQQTKLIQ